MELLKPYPDDATVERLRFCVQIITSAQAQPGEVLENLLEEMKALATVHYQGKDFRQIGASCGMIASMALTLQVMARHELSHEEPESEEVPATEPAEPTN